MHAMPEDRSPSACLALGLDCRNCVERSAETVASICRGATPEGVRGIFLQLYPSTGCAPMAVTFQFAYFDATAPRKPAVRAVAAA